MKKGLKKLWEDSWVVCWRDKNNVEVRQAKRLPSCASWVQEVAKTIYCKKDFIHSIKFVKNELNLSLKEALNVCKAWRGTPRYYGRDNERHKQT